MVQVLDNITIQARQGSVAAIIQVLNAKLADSGVRARAVVAQGVLQLLCEADSPQKLDQAFLVDQLRSVLEAVRPRYIRRVKVNTRLVSEQQLLWLEEIEDNPDSQLLWTAEFSLSRRSPGQWLGDLWQGRKSISSGGAVLADTAERERQKRRAWQTVVGVGGLGIFLCLSGWAIYGSLKDRSVDQTARNEQSQSPVGQDKAVDVANGSLSAASKSGVTESSLSNGRVATNDESTTNLDSSLVATPDSFKQAVRLAEQSVEDGKLAQTPDEWMELATRWQRASDLMGSISVDDDRYAIAQDRTAVYRQNSLDSLKQAELAQQAIAE
ncbi:MAG: hypothetical protein AAGD25_26710 [Cyanobacteria bacterium P01_F01_bin.150]